MPNRIIKESFCVSDKINALTDFEFRLWVGLITYVDDAGRGDARPAIIKGRVFPLQERASVKEIEAAVHSLADKGCISLYKVGGKPYLRFPTWGEHQRIRDVKPKHPGPEESDDVCDRLPQTAAICGELRPESNPNPNPNSNPNTKGAADKSAPFTPPTVDEVRKYCQKRSNAIDPQHFVDYYQANGWVQGKGKPIRDWKAVVRTWEGMDKAKGTNGPTYHPPSQEELERYARERERSRRVLAMMKEEEAQQGKGQPP